MDFMEASPVFGDPFKRTISDSDHSSEEHRFLSLGISSRGRVLVVASTERVENRIRIINARLVSRQKQRDYQPGA